MSGGIILAAITSGERSQIAAVTQGLKGQNFDRHLVSTAAVLTDGVVYLSMVGLTVGEVITNMHFKMSTAATGTSLSKMGIYTVAGTTVTRVALSADQGSAWDSGGFAIRTVPLSTPYTVPTTGGYYFALVSKAATTLAQCDYAQARQANAFGANPPPYGVITGQTDLPASGTINPSSAVSTWWMGFS